MKKLLLCVGLVVLFASSIQAAPTGPGGRIYFTKHAYQGSSQDNQVYLCRIDVDTGWSMTAASVAAGVSNVMAQVTVLDGGGYDYRVTRLMLSPEVIYPRANPDGTSTGESGEIWMCSAPDTDGYWQYSLVTPTGLSSATTSVLHAAAFGSSSTEHTGSNGATGNVGDAKGDALGRPAGVSVWGANGYPAVWNDTDANKDLEDDCDTFDYPGWSAGENRDAECGGAPNDASDEDTVYCYGGASRQFGYVRYTGDHDTDHSWSARSVFYNAKNPGDAPAYRCSLGFAVGDTDGDGNSDFYYICTEVSEVASPSIVRLADLTGNAHIDNEQDDICRVIYNEDTLPGNQNNIGGGDVELVKDPATGKWTLLILSAGSSWSAIDGKIFAVELADNGDFSGASDGVVVVATGIETGFRTTNGYELPEIEFDADPIPEPGMMLLISTGVLGLVGYVRRRRMK